MDVLAQQDTELLIRGLIGLSTGIALLFGSVWLLLSLILGVRLGYLLMGSVLFGIMIIMSLIWLVTAFGPVGPETTWFAVGAAADLDEASREEVTYDVSDYPRGDWITPEVDVFLAEEHIDTAEEADIALPVLRTLVQNATDPKRFEDVEDLIQSDIGLESGAFDITDMMMKDAIIEGRDSIIAMARAVPSERMRAGSLGSAEEGLVKEYLVDIGEEVTDGQPFLVAATESGDVTLQADISGKVLSHGLREPNPEEDFAGDIVKEGTPIAVIDVTGPGQPDPVQVAAVRVRGSVRTPSVYYLLASIVLFALHMVALSRYEKGTAAAKTAVA
jgi:hypothetical protein